MNESTKKVKKHLREKIKKYCKDNKITQQEFGKIIENSYKGINFWINNDSTPNWDTMVKIILETKGEILPNDFFQEVIDYIKK